MSTDRFLRQSFLGPDSEELISQCTIGVVGLGGGGSHIVQQLAHIGFQRYIVYDDDVVEESNLNRLIGAKSVDVPATTPKLHIAKIMIYGLQSKANVRGFACRWQDRPEPLRECQIVFGCVDSYKGREELEIACRRYLMHYIDVGMDVHGTERPVIGGQVILSSPGQLCMRCMGFLTDEKIATEAAMYGNAGSHPQVVWANGVLASTAVGLAVEIVTGWTHRPLSHAYMVYDGNKAIIKESVTLKNLGIRACPHFSDDDVGDPVIVEL
ncbi:MAG TPA: thiamine/molybdopterin biosynthesis protein [Syntrophorhabdus aromaticivorans]|nr:thiamine/molybdopterin biosynthesis protein [Syntrophorhabdus aromaticivorans]